MTELSLNRCDIAGFLDEVPAHGVAGVMGRVAPYPGQLANLIPNRIDHLRIQPAIAVDDGGWQKETAPAIAIF